MLDDIDPVTQPSKTSSPQTAQARRLMRVTERPPIVMEWGSGSVLFDQAGRRYLDFVQGWAVNSLGHAPPEVAEVLASQGKKLLTASPAYLNGPLLELAARLCQVARQEVAYFSSSGAEANEVAVKLARKWGRLHRRGAHEVITCHEAFHGRTLAMMAASGKAGWDALFPPNPPGFVKVPFGDLGAMRAAIGSQTVALMVEPIQGEAGVVVPPAGYLTELRALADREGLLLILDEVQTGMGRTGRLFAHEWEGLRPDILTLGKGLGAGFPIAATLANDRADCFEPGDQGGTFHGAPLGCAVALRVLEVLTGPDFLATVVQRASAMEQRLQRIAAGCGATVEGRGLLQALLLPNPVAPSIRDRALTAGLLVNAARPNRLRLTPSLRVTELEIHEMAEKLLEALTSS